MSTKAVSPGSRSSAAWDSIHVFETIERARTSHYKLTSTVILHLANETDSLGEMNLSGNMTRQVESDMPVDEDGSHVANIGRLVEDMELKMRNLLRKRIEEPLRPGSLSSRFTDRYLLSLHLLEH